MRVTLTPTRCIKHVFALNNTNKDNNMKITLAILLATAVTGYSQMTNVVKVVIPDGEVQGIIALLESMPPVYENTLTQVTNTVTRMEGTNEITEVVVTPTIVTSVVNERPKQKFRRVSAEVLSEFWGSQIQAVERRNITRRTVLDTSE
jgi:hypothetical protein